MDRSFLVAIALLLCLTGQSQSFQVENFNIERGMPSNEAYYVYQDKKGFIWFATDNGVVRFDGQEMKTYHVKQGLVDPVIFGFHEDHLGRIWFRSYSGKLAYYYHDSISAYQHNKYIGAIVNRNLVHSIYNDENDALWFVAGKEIVRIDKDGKINYEVTGLSGLIFKSIDSTHLIGLTGPMPLKTVYINGQYFAIPVEENIASPVVQSIRWNNKFLLCVGKTIFSFDGVKISKIFTATAPVISLSKDNQNNLWVGYRNQGVDRFTDDTFRSVWKPPFIANQSVTKVLQDNEGGLWFTTLEKGAYYVPKPIIQNFSLPSKIKAVAKKSKTVFVGDLKGDLLAINSNTKKIEWTKSFEFPIISLFLDKQKNFWVSTAIGIQKFNEDFVLQPPDTTETEAKIDFFESPDGVLWATGGSKVMKIEGQHKFTYKRLRNIYRAICTTDSAVYLAGRTGLEIYSKKMEYRSSPVSLLNLKITEILPLRDNIIFLATSGSGFILFNEDTSEITQFDSDNNLMANNIYCALFNQSQLWMGTENGVIKTNIDELLSGHPDFSYLNNKSGLASNKINQLLAINNSIWAFTEDGISVIPDSLQNFTNTKPKFYVKTMLVNQFALDLAKNPELRYDQNDIAISFGFISFNNNESIQARFRLSQKDPWVYAENRELQFFSLSPGQYSLSLEYSIDNNHWITAIDQMIFFINPPWWRAWYYQLAGLLIAALSVLLYFKWRLRRSREQQQLHQQKLLQTEIQTTERERSRIAKDLHDTVGTNLAAVKMAVSQLLQKHHEPLSENIESQLQEIINETKEIIYHLVPPGLERLGLFTLARNHISKLNRTAQSVINLSTSGDDVYNAHLNIVIFRIIQELLSNSLKHAKATTITIAINTFESHVNFLYEDNGTGFNKSEMKDGFGLVNIESRIESLQGNVKLETGPLGTSYTINIPYTANSQDMRHPGR